MATVVLGWDLDCGTRWIPPYEQVLTQLALTGPVTGPWRVGAGPVPAPGTRAHLMLQGQTRGLVGRGIVRSAPFRAGAPGPRGTLGTYVLVEWDRLLPVAERIPLERLAQQVPDLDCAGTYCDVLELPDVAGADLDRLWAAPHPAADHPPGWRLIRYLTGALALAGHVRRALTAHS